MSLPFMALATAMLALASSFIVVPLWREGGTLAAHPPKRWAAVWLVTLLAFALPVLYLLVGEPAALQSPSAQHAVAASADAAPTNGADAAVAEGRPAQVDPSQVDPSQVDPAQVGPAQVAAMVERLAQRLRAQPADPAGWRMLIKSYETLGRFDDAVAAYRRLMQLQPPDADLLCDYAVTLGMTQGQSLAGAPQVAIDEALRLAPGHIQALALSGSAAYEQRDYRRAVAQWRQLLARIPADAELRPSIERNVEKAQALIR